MKLKLIDVLIKVENKTLKDNSRVIIEDDLYYYNLEDKKFYTTPKDKHQTTYRNIFTNQLSLPCEILDKVEIIENIPKEIELFEFEEIMDETHYKLMVKCNDLTEAVNYLLKKDK